MAREGVLGADETGVSAQVPTFAIRGPIDIVGAGDSVSANLAMALAAGYTRADTVAGAEELVETLGATASEINLRAVPPVPNHAVRYRLTKRDHHEHMKQSRQGRSKRWR
jgi:bifunctional ADP-heptose synthase (sugar kinase/adenylyltransferase)